jgi:parallel beta-helix repeat protein
MAQEEPATPGIISGTGTSFAVTDSDYLNVSVVSTVEIILDVNSSPTIINMMIAAAAGAASTDITLGGLEANTTYWMYQDTSIDSVEFTTDGSGNHSFTQDLSVPHSIRVQPGESTVIISDDGASGTGYQCTLVGTWDATTKTCTLTQDVNDSIVIHDPYGTNVGVTLDGAGFQVNLPPWGWVRLTGTGHTVKNLTINGTEQVHNPYYCGIYGGTYCELQPTGYGIYLHAVDSATVTNVTVSNAYYGLLVWSSSNNTISDSTFSGAAYGAFVHGSYSQYWCDLGHINYCGATDNTLSHNSFSPYSTYWDYIGVFVSHAARNNIVTGNTISEFNRGAIVYDWYCYHGGSGHGWCPDGNEIYQNNFINSNNDQIQTRFGYTSSVFNLAAPDGGNYYSDFDETVEGCSDVNVDGFCDAPYSIASSNATDYLPWTVQDGWLNALPVADAGGPYLVAVGGTIALDGSASFDPDGDPLTETWTADGGTVSGSNYTAGSVPGIYDVGLVVNDGQGDSPLASTTVVVYDPTGGFVTGGGWINSPANACHLTTACEELTGKANFGFVSKYKKGASTPTGETQFVFHAGDLSFHSDTYEWLVVNQGGANAQYKGTGTINGALDPNGMPYGFMLWGNDGDNADPVSADTFRIRIWSETPVSEVVVYDNGFDQPISGGSIVIHTGGKGGKK